MAELTDGFVLRPEIQSLLPKVEMEIDDRQNEVGYSPYDLVTVALKDGRTIVSKEVSEARGGANTPLRPKELETKFLDCVEVGQGGPEGNSSTKSAGPQLFAALQRLDHVRNMREVRLG